MEILGQIPTALYNPARVPNNPNDPDYLKKLALIGLHEGEHELKVTNASSPSPAVVSQLTSPKSSNVALPMDQRPSTAPLVPPIAPKSDLDMAIAERPAVLSLMDKARTIGGQHPGILGNIKRTLGEVGAGALTGGEALGESMFPSIAANIPGTFMARERGIGEALTGERAQLVNTPYGPMPAALATRLIGAKLSKEKGTETATITGEAKKAAAKIGAGAKEATEDPIKKLFKEAADAYQSGDMDTYNAKLKEAHDMTSAKAPDRAPNIISLTQATLHGDKNAQATLQKIHDDQKELALEHGMGYRLNQIQSYIDPDTGELVPMTGFAILDAKKQGKNFIPAGRMPVQDVVAIQQLVSEAGPKDTPYYNKGALKPIYDNLGAFNNESDKALFARVLKGAGTATRGDEASWMGNIMNQALQGNLSPEGRKLATGLGRLAETMGRLRASLGLPSTDNMMALSLALIPGPGTPDSKYAEMQLNNLEQMIEQAQGVPVFKSIAGGRSTATTELSTRESSAGKPPADITPPAGWRWEQKNGKWGITNGQQFRPYLGK